MQKIQDRTSPKLPWTPKYSRKRHATIKMQMFYLDQGLRKGLVSDVLEKAPLSARAKNKPLIPSREEYLTSTEVWCCCCCYWCSCFCCFFCCCGDSVIVVAAAAANATASADVFVDSDVLVAAAAVVVFSIQYDFPMHAVACKVWAGDVTAVFHRVEAHHSKHRHSPQDTVQARE